ncbi:MAG: hypothetical protein IJA90_08875 [Peptococcaceae bacterium]|nr:hypothetical protein [Peptococcaceae bacterium]
MKKWLSILLVFMMMFTLTACGGGGGEADQQEANNNEAVEQPADENAPVSSISLAADKGSYWSMDAADAQELLVSMGLPEYPDGEIIYGSQFESDNSGTIYINNTSLDACVSYCESIANVSPAYAESNSNGEYLKYEFANDNYEFVVKYFAAAQERSYKRNGEPVKDTWQAEIDFTPVVNDEPAGSAIADGWEIPEYPYGEVVYTEYDENGAVVSLYINNTTVEECHEYCIDVENKGFMEVTNNDIHVDSDGLGNYMHYIAMHPSSYINYEISYEYDGMEHTVATPDGEVPYQLVISNRGK